LDTENKGQRFTREGRAPTDGERNEGRKAPQRKGGKDREVEGVHMKMRERSKGEKRRDDGDSRIDKPAQIADRMCEIHACDESVGGC
jgi:hypothetical protein